MSHTHTHTHSPSQTVIRSLWIYSQLEEQNRSQEVCERGGGRPGLPVLETDDSPYGLCGRRAEIVLMVSVDVEQK